jgi:hypothetical protein
MTDVAQPVNEDAATPDASPPNGGGTQPSDDNGDGNDNRGRSIAVVIGIVALAVVVVGGARVLISSLGLSVPVWVDAASATAVALGGLLAAQRKNLIALPGWAFPLGLLVGAVLVVLAVIFQPDPGPFDGDLANGGRDSRMINVDPGDRYTLVLDTSGGLKAELLLQRGTFHYAGTPAADGTSRIDETLSAGRWRLSVIALDGTSGHFTVDIGHDAAQNLAVGDVVDDELVDDTDSNGYLFAVPTARKLYVNVHPTDPTDLPLDVVLLNGNGYVSAIPRQVGSDWQIFKQLRKGDYTFVVRSPEHRRGSYTLKLLADAPSGTPTETTVARSTLVEVPNVVRQPEPDALAALAGAGLSPAPIRVCSSSVGEGIVRQVVRAQSGPERIVVDLDGVHEQQLPGGTQLVVKVGTGQPCATN